MVTSPAAPARRLWLGVLCGYLALGATLQELPEYMIGRYGAGPAATGLAVSAAFLATAIVRPLAGRAGDAGQARPVVMAGGALTALAAVGHLLAPTVGLLLFARLLMGAGEAALFSASLPWVLAGTSADRRGRVSGWFGLSMWGGLTLGPLLAVGVRATAGTTAVWLAVVVLPLISTVLAATNGRQPPPAHGVSLVPRRLRDVLPAGVGLPGLVLGLSAYGYGSITALVVLYLTTRHTGGQGLALSVYAIAFLITRSLGSPQVDRRGPVIMARLSVTVEAVGLLLVAMGTTPVGVLVGAGVTGIGLGTIYPATSALTLHRTSAVLPGVAMGSMTSLWDLGIVVAGPIGGAIAGGLGFPAAFGLAAIVSGVAFLLAMSLRRVPASHAPEPITALSAEPSARRIGDLHPPVVTNNTHEISSHAPPPENPDGR